MLFAAALLPIAFLSAAHPKVNRRYHFYSQRAIQMNELAGHIDSLDDAHKLVSMMADERSSERAARSLSK